MLLVERPVSNLSPIKNTTPINTDPKKFGDFEIKKCMTTCNYSVNITLLEPYFTFFIGETQKTYMIKQHLYIEHLYLRPIELIVSAQFVTFFNHTTGKLAKICHFHS